MATYTFIAHSINIVGGNINVVGSSTFTIVLTDDDATIGDAGDTGEAVSLDGGPPQSYVFLGVGVTDNGEDMAVIEIGGVQYAFDLDGGELDNGNTKVKLANLDDTPIVPCFTPGTFVATPDGPQLVETLQAGDLVHTRDNGPQPIVRVLRRSLTRQELKLKPHLMPILLKSGSLGPNVPAADLQVSPQHRVLVDDWRAELLFGEEEVLVTARSLVNDISIVTNTADSGVEYIHLIFSEHEIIYANGTATESVLLSSEFLSATDLLVRCELCELFPEFTNRQGNASWHSVAPAIRHFEGRIL